jgi:hypothetical protein
MMDRKFISTKDELAGYLKALAWKRYRVHYDAVKEGLEIGEGPLSQSEVRAAVAAMESKIRWLLYAEHYQRGGPKKKPAALTTSCAAGPCVGQTETRPF